MRRALRLALLLCMALPCLAAAQAQQHQAQAQASRVPKPMIEPARAGTQCIADPATMRREHPAMLEHQRDATVRGGIRGAKASLKACIACHASAQTGSVAKTETNFCISCHSYTAVRVDCFGCHASRPASTSFHPIAPMGPQAKTVAMLTAQLKAKPVHAGGGTAVAKPLP